VKDEDQSLFAFEIVWTVGVVWMILIKWPVQLRIHFWRRSPLAESDYVRIWSPTEKKLIATGADIAFLTDLFSKLDTTLNGFFSFIYSDITLPKENGMWEICDVHTSLVGERFITYHLRQLVYSVEENAFIPVVCQVPSTVEELLAAVDGHTSHEAMMRRVRVGPNTIQVPEPSIIRVLIQEFSIGFYTYQVFFSR
jgi:hypothetical protein